MTSSSKHLLILLALCLSLLPACAISNPLSADGTAVETTRSLGYRLTGANPVAPTGDESAPSYVFIHHYPMPGDGVISGVLFLNDTDDIPEAVTLLVLRPVKRGWQVVQRVALPNDDTPPAASGYTLLALNPPLAVKKDDVFAHWQPKVQLGGPIPFDPEDAPAGQSAGQPGFDAVDIEVGETITDQGFNGRRGYFINVIFKAAP